MSEIFSHSRLSSFEDCPKKFHYRYVLRLPSKAEGIEGFMGRRVHEVLERLYRFTAEGRVPPLARVLERFQLFWDEHFDPVHVRIVRDGLDVDHYRRIGERCLTNYYRRHYPFDADETIAVEDRVLFSLDAERRYRIQGFIDRVVNARDGALEIHDYKTSARLPSQAQLDRDRQLALYQIGLAERFGRSRPVRLVWHYLAHDRARVSERRPEQLESLRRDTMELIDRIRAERDFEPRKGPLCRWCEFADRCPLGPGLARSAGPVPLQASEPPLPPEPLLAPSAPERHAPTPIPTGGQLRLL